MKKITWLIIIIIIASAAWYLGSPLFIDKEVDESFPGDVPASTSVILTPEELADMTPEQLETIRDDTMERAAAMPDKIMTESMPDTSGPNLLKQGSFRGADSFHAGVGEAKIFELADGTKILRFENFDVTNGPDLRVLLVSNPNPQNSSDVKSGNYIEIARLKGNKGNQNYELPDDYNIKDAGSVVIYCKPFKVIFSVASLR